MEKPWRKRKQKEKEKKSGSRGRGKNQWRFAKGVFVFFCKRFDVKKKGNGVSLTSNPVLHFSSSSSSSPSNYIERSLTAFSFIIENQALRRSFNRDEYKSWKHLEQRKFSQDRFFKSRARNLFGRELRELFMDRSNTRLTHGPLCIIPGDGEDVRKQKINGRWRAEVIYNWNFRFV